MRKLFLLVTFLTVSFAQSALAVDLEYPQVIKVRYEALDPKSGGNFVIWSEREKITMDSIRNYFPQRAMSK